MRPFLRLHHNLKASLSTYPDGGLSPTSLRRRLTIMRACFKLISGQWPMVSSVILPEWCDRKTHDFEPDG